MIKNNIVKLSILFGLLSLMMLNISVFTFRFHGHQKMPTNIRGSLINTELQLFLNGNTTNDGDKINVEIDDVINITVFYRDFETGNHIPNATVQLLGWANLNETNNQDYNITINANDLEQGITILTIYAEKDNYQPQNIQFLVELSERASQLQLFLNEVLKTNDPVYELLIKQFLNITVKYTDNQTGAHISGATILLIGEGFTFNLTEDTELEQYYYNLNTIDLGIGIKLFTIIAYAPNYRIKTIDIRVTINRIPGTISRVDGGAQIIVNVGEDVLLKITLKDPQNNTIKNATVTYTWAYGQGELEDLDNDGIYTIILHNVREGVHTITIFAVAGDDYSFKEYKITMIVNTPPPYIVLLLMMIILFLVYIITLLS